MKKNFCIKSTPVVQQAKQNTLKNSPSEYSGLIIQIDMQGISLKLVFNFREKKLFP